MILPGDDSPVSKVGNAAYYDRLKVEGEFYTLSEKHVFHEEINRRFGYHRMDQAQQLAERRRRLLSLLQCEAERDRSLCSQKTEDEIESRKTGLFEEAARMQQKLREREARIAEEKYAERYFKATYPIRGELTHLHAAEIAKDREWIDKLNAWDRAREEREEKQLMQIPSLWNEHLEREDVKRAEIHAQKREMANEYLKLNTEKRENEKKEQQLELEEELRELDILRKDLAKENGTVEEHLEKRKQRLAYVQGDVAEARNRRTEQERLDKMVDNYCNPTFPPIDPSIEAKRVEQQRKEQLRFIEYQKTLKPNEECHDKLLDQHSGKLREAFEAKAREKRMKHRALLMESTKEMVAQQLEAVAKKEDALHNAKAICKEQGAKVRKDHQLYLEQVRMEEMEKLQSGRKIGKEMIQQIQRQERLKQQWEKEECEREREAMLKAECEYQKRLRKVLDENPLKKFLHPWRKPQMTKNN